MTADDKYGMGAALLTLGLAAGLVLLGQKLPPDMWTFFPHREMVKAEAIFDFILLVCALPAGIFFFVQGALGGRGDREGK